MHSLSNAVIEHLYKAADSRDILNAGIGAGVGAGGAALAGGKENLVRNLILGALAGGATGAAYNPALKPLASAIFKSNPDSNSSVLTSALGGATLAAGGAAGNDFLKSRVRLTKMMGTGQNGPLGATFKDLANSDDMKLLTGGKEDTASQEHANRYVQELTDEQLRRSSEILSGKGGLRAKITSLLNKVGPLKEFTEGMSRNQAYSDMLSDPRITNKILGNDAAYTPAELAEGESMHDANFDKSLADANDTNNKANRFRLNARTLEADLAGGKPIKKIDPDLLNNIRNSLANGTSLEEVLKTMSGDVTLPENLKYVDNVQLPTKTPFDPPMMAKRTNAVVSNDFIEKLKGISGSAEKKLVGNLGAGGVMNWGKRLGNFALLGGMAGGGAAVLENGIRKAVGA